MPPTAAQFCFELLKRQGLENQQALQSIGLGVGLTRDLVRPQAAALAIHTPLGPIAGWSHGWVAPDRATNDRQELWGALKASPLVDALLLPWYGDTAIEAQVGDDLTRCILFGGCYEPNEMWFASQMIQAGDTVIDVGAHHGAWTLALAGMVGRHGTVVAMEPFADTYQRLSHNVTANGLANIVCLNQAALSAAGACSMEVGSPGHSGLTRISSTTSGPQVAKPLDEVRDELGRRVSFIKLDVEGSELLALEGARRLLAQDRPAILCEVVDAALSHHGADAAGILAFFDQAGYTCGWIDEAVPSLRRSRRDSEYLLAVPRGNQAFERQVQP